MDSVFKEVLIYDLFNFVNGPVIDTFNIISS